MIYLFLIFQFFQSSQTNAINNDSSLEILFKNKRVALCVNASSVNNKGQHLLSILQNQQAQIKAIFVPEHGLESNIANGEIVLSDTSLHIYSLYGKDKKPKKEQLDSIDYFIYDLQDVGTRFYTYISTLGLIMQACAESSIPLIILDRINYTGRKMDGAVLEDSLKSFVGFYPIPASYGLTVGELAKMIQGEAYLENITDLKLQIIPLFNKASTVKFIKPSPNIIDIEAIHLYKGLCLLEASNVSEGRGTFSPFKLLGAKWMEAKKVKTELSKLGIKGILLKDTLFTPHEINGMAKNPKFNDTLISGLKLKITDIQKFDSFEFTLKFLYTLKQLYPNDFKIISSSFFKKLSGKKNIEDIFISQKKLTNFLLDAKKERDLFDKKRMKYFLYKNIN
jgi:uncharacterized protein YbbC (DUF1343 family)